MIGKIQLGFSVAILMVAVVFSDNSFLAEKPAYFKTCKQTDSNFNSCFAKNFQVVISEWKDGVPGLKTVGTLDPLHIKRISIVQDNNNAVVQLNVDLTDIKAIGISKMKMEEASYDADKLVVKIKVLGPKLHIDSQYAMKGKILNLPLNGSGKCTMEIDNIEFAAAIRVKPRNEHNNIFADIDKFRLDITKVGGFHVQLDNLFNGQKELEDSTNALINQNWQTFFEVLNPAISAGIETVVADRFKKVFAHVPVTYFIEDFSSKN